MLLVKRMYSQSLRNYCFLALLTSLVLSVAYFATEQQVSHDTLSSTAITEVADYTRTFENNADDDRTLFIVTPLFSQPIQVSWIHVISPDSTNTRFTDVSYRTRPRSPPFQSSI